MKKKYKLQIALVLILFNCLFLSVNVVSVEYTLGINDNDTYIWKIEELDKDIYERIFVIEAGFNEDDQKKIQISTIEENSERWRVVYLFWDYTDDTDDFSEGADDEKAKKVFKDPEEQADEIIDMESFGKMWLVPNPYINYIEGFRDEFDNPFFEVHVEDETLVMKPAVENAEYEIGITYSGEGVAERIEYIDAAGETFVEIVLLKETIPDYVFGIIGIIIISGIISIIIVVYYKKNFKKRKTPMKSFK